MALLDLSGTKKTQDGSTFIDPSAGDPSAVSRSVQSALSGAFVPGALGPVLVGITPGVVVGAGMEALGFETVGAAGPSGLLSQPTNATSINPSIEIRSDHERIKESPKEARVEERGDVGWTKGRREGVGRFAAIIERP